jgi:hypothetical protein
MKKKKSVKIFMIAIILLAQITIIFASGNSGNYSHPHSTLAVDTLNMKVLVPAYFNPSSSNYWARLATQSAKMPGRLWTIADVDNGPGSKYDTTYAVVINNMHLNHGKVIGYVWTNYGAITLDKVKADIDAWYSFYNSIDGIFLDGQAYETGKEAYYIEIYNYIKQKNSSALVVSNPGVNTIVNYLVNNGVRVSDVVCIFESNEGFDTWTPSTWITSYTSDNFYVLPYNTTSSQWVSRLNRAASLNIGWIYLTDDTGNNPWDTLPSYFEDFCSYIVNIVIK